MPKQQRQAEILEILGKKGFMTVEKLSDTLFASLPTIRRDLAELAHKNRVIRCRGGARLADDGTSILPLEYRIAVNPTEKKELCRAVANFVHDGDVLFLDSSTTLYPLIPLLHERNEITVITDGLETALMARRAGIRTYCTGGELFDLTYSMSGLGSADILNRFHIDLFLFSSHGVDDRGNIVDNDEALTELRRQVLRVADYSLFVCVEEKFHLTAPHIVSPLSAVDYVVTNCRIPASLSIDPEKVFVVSH